MCGAPTDSSLQKGKKLFTLPAAAPAAHQTISRPYHFSTGQRWCCGDHSERHLLPVSFQWFYRVIAGGGFVPPPFTSFKLCPPLCNFIALLAPSSPRLLPQFAFVMDSISSGSSSVLGAIGSHVDAMSEVSAQEPFFSRRCPLSLPLAHFNCRRDD